MKCTKDEFINKLYAAHPAKYLCTDIDPVTGIWYTFVLDTAGEMDKDIVWKFNNSSHSWRESASSAQGDVINDSDGLFSPPTFTVTGPITVTLPSANTTSNKYYYWYSGNAQMPASKPLNLFDSNDVVAIKPKCGCGSHSVGSNKHSSYCDLFELENA